MRIKNKLLFVLLLVPIFALQQGVLFPIKAVKKPPTLKELQKKISNLEKSLEAARRELKKQEERAPLSTDVTELQEQVKGLKEENGQLETDLKKANKEIKKLVAKNKKQENELARGKKAKTRDEISDNERIASLTEEIEEYRKKLKRLRKKRE